MKQGETLFMASEAVLLGYLERQRPSEDMSEDEKIAWLADAIKNHGNVIGLNNVKKMVEIHPQAKNLDIFSKALAKVLAEK